MSSAAMCGNRTGAHVNVLVLADLTAGRYPPASAREARSLGRQLRGPSRRLHAVLRRAVLDRCPRPRQIFEVANTHVYATGLLALQRQYAAWSAARRGPY